MIIIIALFAILITYLYFHNKSSETKLQQTITNLQTEIRKLKDNTNSSFDVIPLDGIFEVHITVKHNDNYVKLLEFIKRYEKEKGMKLIYAVSSKANNQYMISYFTRKDDDKLAVDSANKIAKEMIKEEIEISRIKVESHNTKNTPQTDENYFQFHKYLEEKYGKSCGKPYFEFHVKVNAHKTKQSYFKDLEHECTKFNGVAVSYNICGQNKKPLITIRLYDKGFLNAQHYKDHVIDTLKTIGYTFEDRIQQEFSIYDTNAEQDYGWL